jgi:hypothetical protein
VKAVYLAARFAAHQEMRGVRDALTALGLTVTSRWIDLDPAVVGGQNGIGESQMNSDPAACAPYAQADLEDLMAADTVAIFTQFGPSGTGGRHVELGVALACSKRIIVVGPRENILMTLPQIEHFPDWSALAFVLGQNMAEWWRTTR